MAIATAAPETAKPKRKRAKKAAPTVSADAVAELSFALTALYNRDISTPENAPIAGNIFARMMLLTFVADMLGIPTDGREAATGRAKGFFNAHPRHPTADAYYWGLKMYSELHNCRQYVEQKESNARVFLGLLIDTLAIQETIKDKSNFIFAKNLVIDATRYIKAFNETMTAMAKIHDTPELSLVKISIAELIKGGEAYNKRASGEDRIDIETMRATPPKDMQYIIKDFHRRSHMTVLSLLNVAHMNMVFVFPATGKANK